MRVGSWMGVALCAVGLSVGSADARIKLDKQIKAYSESMIGRTGRLKIPVAIVWGSKSNRIEFEGVTEVGSDGSIWYQPNWAYMKTDSVRVSSLSHLLDAIKTRPLMEKKANRTGVTNFQWSPEKLVDDIWVMREGDRVEIIGIHFDNKSKDGREYGPDIRVELWGLAWEVGKNDWVRRGKMVIPVYLRGEIGTIYQVGALEQGLMKLLEFDEVQP